MKNSSKIPDSPPEIALWRYGLISQLLHRDPIGRSIQEVLEDLATAEYRDPAGRTKRLSPETLRKWLTRYRIGGLAALADQERSDKGKSLVPEPILDRVRALRADHPRWTLAVIFRTLLQEKTWNGIVPSAAALYRCCRLQALERKPVPPECRSFAFENFGELWVADFLHGPRLTDGKQKRKTYLHVILDDASRFVVSAGVFLSEDVENLIAELKRAVRCYGIPQRLYTDNGAAYRSRHLRIVGGRLAIQMPHTPPYRPQGRGKIERFFRTVREQFLATTNARTIEELGQGLQHWIAEYHQTVHETISVTPLQKRAVVPSVCRLFPECTPIEMLFYMERRCRVYNDGTIRFKRRSFEVPEVPPGSRVTIYFEPAVPTRVWYGEHFHLARPLDRTNNARRFDHPPARKEK